MKEFEYKSFDAWSYLSEEELNKCGKDGWELVSVHPDRLKCNVFHYVFKREVVYERLFEYLTVYRDLLTFLTDSDLKDSSKDGWRLLSVSEPEGLIRYYFERESKGQRVTGSFSFPANSY